jgi:hypothetical protein
LIVIVTPNGPVAPACGGPEPRPHPPPDSPRCFTAERAKNAKGPRISEYPGDSTVRVPPDSNSHFHSRVLEIPGISLRALRPLRFKCNVSDHRGGRPSGHTGRQMVAKRENVAKGNHRRERSDVQESLVFEARGPLGCAGSPAFPRVITSLDLRSP